MYFYRSSHKNINEWQTNSLLPPIIHLSFKKLEARLNLKSRTFQHTYILIYIIYVCACVHVCMFMCNSCMRGLSQIVVATKERLVRQMCNSSGNGRQKCHIERTNARMSEWVNDWAVNELHKFRSPPNVPPKCREMLKCVWPCHIWPFSGSFDESMPHSAPNALSCIMICLYIHMYILSILIWIYMYIFVRDDECASPILVQTFAINKFNTLCGNCVCGRQHLCWHTLMMSAVWVCVSLTMGV